MENNTFANKRPDLMKYWDYEKNNKLGIDPNQVTEHSGRKAYWKCEKGHSYERVIDKQGYSNGRCPVCNKKLTVQDIPELRDIYDHEKNDIPIEKLALNAHKKVYWKCENGHSYMAYPYNQYRRKNSCPLCAHKYLIDFPELVKEFDTEKNDIPIEKVTSGIDKKIHWKCQYGHEWETKPCNRMTSKNTGCPVCWEKDKMTKIREIKQQKKKERELQQQLLKEKKLIENEKQRIKRENKEKEDIKYEVYRITGTRVENKELLVEESIAWLHPKAAALWNKERNNGLDATEVFGKTEERYFWWKCEKGHEWLSQLGVLLRSPGNGCLYCAKKASKYSI